MKGKKKEVSYRIKTIIFLNAIVVDHTILSSTTNMELCIIQDEDEGFTLPTSKFKDTIVEVEKSYNG